MPLIKYQSFNFRADTLNVINQARTICEDYARRGYDLTLRQLYYQFVARDLIPNRQQSYDRLGKIVSDARLAGMIDWNHIVDRTRNLAGTSHWDDPSQIMRGAASSFRLDKWEGQPKRVEVWVEKEALAGVIARAANALDVDYFSCRGYVSQSEIWRAGRRFRNYINNHQEVLILHLGDHDPSGIDMTRDIKERLAMFSGYGHGTRLEVRRIALNMDQVEEYNPPPNFAKLTDARANEYIAEYGDSSWELDALDPAVLDDLIQSNIRGEIDWGIWNQREELERQHRDFLELASDNWEQVANYLRETFE